MASQAWGQAVSSQKRDAAQLLAQGIELRQQRQFQAALKTLQKALILYQTQKDPRGQRNSWYAIGDVYYYQSQYLQALKSYQESFATQQAILAPNPADLKTQAVLLNDLGLVSNRLDQKRRALEFYNQALPITKAVKDRNSEAATLNNIGSVYADLGQKQRALAFYNQALPITKAVKDRDSEAATFNNIGRIYADLGQKQKALKFYDRALPILKEIGNRSGEATILNNLGGIYADLGQKQKALKFYDRALPILKEIGNRNGEAITLNNMGGVYNDLDQRQKALDLYNQALPIRREVGDRSGEAATLNNIGSIYDDLGQRQKALDLYNQALLLQKEIGDRSGEATTLNNIGSVYDDLGQQQRALDLYNQALSIRREVGDRGGEAGTLNNIGVLLSAQNQSELAIIFYKQSVNIKESLRDEIRSLSSELQQSYTQTIASTYRDLANLLLQQDRVLEAQQVLDLLKVQELDDYLSQVRGNTKTSKGVTVLKPELAILNQLSESQENVIQLGQELTKLRHISQDDRTQTQQKRIDQLVKLQQNLNQDFNQFIASPAVQTALGQLSRTAQRQSVDLADLDALRDNLKQLNAVLLYPLILEDRLELVITTPNSAPIRRTVSVSRQELNQTIVAFRRALQDRRSSDVKPLAQKLYSWLVQPIEADLKQANAETIIYAPDGQLRYIPLPALHDGDQWLVQRLRVNNITAKSFSNLNPQTQGPLSILAGAFVSGQYSFQVGAEQFAFSGLPFAGKEVSQLVTTIPGTTRLLDQDFSVAKFQPRMNEHSIVHLATHAAFVPGQPEDSFILFGNGDRATLRDIGSWSLFNVDLVVLSACETGLGGKFGNGEEVLGLGYQFQNRGAKATLASLWQVDDGGTQMLMSAFYGNLKAGPVSKAEALRQAQIAMITGRDSSMSDQRGSIKVVDDQPRKQKQKNNLSHPYYWAPFILIGNGL
ncbi:Glucose starvation-inducible protein B [Acaryochloris thomasi RCC1774]|uniref:Glucose starvation-inducible protein B n=2 Tax=Acaryochloris TaxID=155977 RepID=A0A2W1K069_9CYAN|nr:Glucose starvation-inducible protein B [Acaryochloris thomasi RCC1774]